MQIWLKQFVFAVLLLVLPLQGLAAALMPIMCHSDKQQTSVPAHVHESGDSSTHENTTQNHDDQPGSDYSGHLCCHHPVGAILTYFAVVADAVPTVYVLQPVISPSLFSPEQQLRPPRS